MAEELEAALPDDVCRLAERILAAAKDRGWQLATAESCTGGLLAALFTDVPGYSHVFDRGVVSYSDGAKCDLLGLASDMVENCGAVSRAVAEAMAAGALERSDAQLAVSITGFAGPGGEDDEEGLVHFALADAARESWEQIIGVNLMGTMNFCKAKKEQLLLPQTTISDFLT